MMDRKKKIEVLKDILKGEQPIAALDDDYERATHKFIIYLKRDGKFFKGGQEITEAEYNETLAKPGVYHIPPKHTDVHINVKRIDAFVTGTVDEDPNKRQMKLPDGTFIDL